uniref:Mucin-3A-like n=1 Tax=Rhipicephalus zambeziensis TaxID=60191 RepID=A0A224Z2G0_9ACAR
MTSTMTSLTARKGRPHHPALLALVAVLLVPLALGTVGVAAASDPPSTTDASVGTSTGAASSPANDHTVKNIASTLHTTTPGAPLDNATATPTASSAHTTASAHTSEQTSSLGHQTSTASSETTTGKDDSKIEHTSTVTTTEAVTTPAVNHSYEATVTTSTDIDGHQPNATSGTEPTPSAAVTITTVAPTTLLPTTTKRRMSEVTEEDVVMKSTPTQRRLLLVLRGNCSHDSLKSDVEGAFRNLSSAAENISVTDIRCTTLLDVNVTFKAGELQLKQLLRNLSLAGTLQLGGGDRHFLLTDFSVKEQVSTDGARTVRSRWVPTREELIIYVAVAVLFGIVLIIACVVCSIRCCRRQPSKTLDFLDTPRLNLRLEDYTLTRIPRPHTVYADHLRTPDQELGVVQAFDTCVVPLEDVMPPPAPTVPAPPCPPPRRPAEGWRTEPLMTFGGKPTKASPANGLKVARRSATRAEEEDDDESSLRGNGALSTSTERLARRDSGRRQGVDNPIYLVDRRKSKG